MAIKTNLKKTQLKAEQERARAAAMSNYGRPILRWKASKGANKIRVLPPWTAEGPSAELFWKEMYQHWNITALDDPESDTKFNVPCVLKTPGMDFFTQTDQENLTCRVCEELAEMKASGDPSLVALAKEWRARNQFTLNIIDVNDPVWTKADIKELKAGNVDEKWIYTPGTPKVQIYGCPATVFNNILDLFADNVDITDIEEGYDITINRQGTGKKDTKYVVNPVLKSTPAPIKEKELEPLLYNLDEVTRIFSYKQIEAIFAGATFEEVFEITPPPSTNVLDTKKESRQLPAPKEEEVEEVEDLAAAAESINEPQDEQQEEPEQEPPTKEVNAAPAFDIPVDKDGDIEYDKLTDEDIENKDNAEHVVKAGTDYEHGVHIACFGAARERDMNTEDCVDCGLTIRCGNRIKQLDEMIAKKKKRRGRPPKKTTEAAPQEEPKKRKIGGKRKSNGDAKQNLTAQSDADALKQNMLAALQKGQH